MLYRSVEDRGLPERRGPGAYCGRSLDTFPRPSFNVLAHDSIRHRMRVLQAAERAARTQSSSMRADSDSLVMRARDIMSKS